MSYASMASTAGLCLFAVLLVLALGFQVYIARKVFAGESGLSVVGGILRGTRTFIRGWQRADELEIRGLMILWTGIIVALAVLLCIFAFLAPGVLGTSGTTP